MDVEPSPMSPAKAELERFVRETLGCTCPAEVFQRVDETPSARSSAAGVARRIAIGGRLLVYLVRATQDEVRASPTAAMHDWITAGLAERDANRMNRVRIVVVLPGRDPGREAEFHAAFAAHRPAADERIHLHLIDAATAAAILPPL